MYWKIAPNSRDTGSDMLFKVIALFLAFMAVLSMFGRLRYPGKDRIESMKCPRCGKFRIGKSTCDCSRKG